MNKDKIVYSIVVILTPLYRINDKQNIQLSQNTIHIFYVNIKANYESISLFMAQEMFK